MDNKVIVRCALVKINEMNPLNNAFYFTVNCPLDQLEKYSKEVSEYILKSKNIGTDEYRLELYK